MPYTNFPGGITSMGVPVNGEGIPATKGNYFFVDYGNGDDGRSTKSNSSDRPFKTVAKALSLATTNNDDVIILQGSSSHTLTEMLDVSINRVHFVGMDGTLRRYGQNAKIQIGVTTAATDIAAVQNTGTRNTFTNIKFICSNTVAQGLYAVADGGEYSLFSHCEFYKDTDLDVTGAAELLCNADSGQYYRCTFGSLVNAISGAILRPCVQLARETLTGKVARDVTFEDCLFWRNAGNTANTYVSAPGATDVERMLWLNRCTFVNAKLASAVPAQCVKTAAQTQGQILIDNCSSINNTALSTSTGPLITGAVPTYATSGIAVAS